MTENRLSELEPSSSAAIALDRRSSIETLRGSITSVGFQSGHRFVIGWWRQSPIGPFADVMWSDPGNRNRLIAEPRAAAFVNDIYPFDQHVPHEVIVKVSTTKGASNRNTLTVDAGPITLSLSLGRLLVPFPPRPRRLTATVERRLARRLLGVHTYGVSPTGVEEWYRTRSLRRVSEGHGYLNGTDLGSIAPVARPLGFGFSDPPRLPLHVKLRVDLRRPYTPLESVDTTSILT